MRAGVQGTSWEAEATVQERPHDRRTFTERLQKMTERPRTTEHVNQLGSKTALSAPAMCSAHETPQRSNFSTRHLKGR